MKKQLLFVLIMCCAFSLQAQNDTLFKQGKTNYKEGNYSKAVDNWEAILDEGKMSAEVYFNLGNAYYKLNQVGPSIYYYEKALQLDPSDKDIKNNLRFAQNRTIDVIEPMPKSIFTRWYNNVSGWFPLDGWAWLTVAMAILFVILFLAYYLSYATRRKRLYFTLSMLFLGCMLLALSFSFMIQSDVQNNRQAIIYTDQVAIYDEPTKSGNVSFRLHEGTKVKIIDVDIDWARIQLADGKDGWMPMEQLREL